MRLRIAALSVLAVAVSSCGASKSPVRFETATVDKGTIVSRVTATGTLSALVTVQVGSQVSGRIGELHADFNDKVKKGQLLAKLDPQLFQAALDQARANALAADGQLKKARVQALDAERQAARSKSLLERQLIAQAEFDTAQANADAANAQVAALTGTLEQARAQLRQAEINLGYTTINSPISGVVISRNVELGQTVAASLQAPTLFVLAEDLAHMQVDTAVSEADVGKLAVDMQARFRVDAYPGETFLGRLRQIRNSPQTVQNVVTYDAVLDVDNPDLKLKPGMTANVTFVTAEKDDVLRVPNAALRFKPSPEMMGEAKGGRGGRDGGSGPRGAEWKPPEGKEQGPNNRRTLYKLAAGAQKPEAVAVKTGLTDGTFTEIVEGELQAGDVIVTDASGGTASGAPGGNNPLAPRPGGGGPTRRAF